MKVAQISFTKTGNALGRAWSNWMALSAVGIEVVTVVPASGETWKPVADERLFVESFASRNAAMAMGEVDLVMALKPWPGSLDIGRQLARKLDVPIVVDVDDPDFEAMYGERLYTQAVSFVRRWRQPPTRAYRLRASAANSSGMILSNPSLRRWYGDHPVAPHCRHVASEPRPGDGDDELVVAFVGTVTRHKGIATLRQAVALTPGARLVVTGLPPEDASDRETWLGHTSMQQGREIAAAADIVAIPSTPGTYSYGQLPAKLMDGLTAGKAIVASDVPPVRWALGDAGVLVPPGDPDALAAAIDGMRPIAVRATYGERALSRAERLFSPTVVGQAFKSAFAEAND